MDYIHFMVDIDAVPLGDRCRGRYWQRATRRQT